MDAANHFRNIQKSSNFDVRRDSSARMVITPMGADHLPAHEWTSCPAPAATGTTGRPRSRPSRHCPAPSRDARFRIVASHARSDELIDSLQQMRVDVAIIDLTLARDDRSASELTPAARALSSRHPARFCDPSPRSTSTSSSPWVSAAVSKAEPLPMLADAIVRYRRVRDSHRPHAAGRLRRAQPQRARSTGAPAGGPDCFEIALRRHRSIKTVSTQKVAALRKLRLRNDAEIYAMRQQLESP
jgi:DNA-binding NarL/FixJ family response regulator